MRLLGSAIVAGVLASASAAYAQEAERDGLYLQGSLGAAHWRTYIQSHEILPASRFEGWGAAYGLRAGWTWSGFTLGLGVEGRTISAEERVEQYGQDGTDDDVRGVTTGGPFIDWFLGPQEVFHLGVMPGTGGCESCEAGINFCVWAGLDVPMKEHWWVGVEPRYLTGGGFFGESSSREILVTVTYNGALPLREQQHPGQRGRRQAQGR